MATSDKYDRQLRLWGSSGQKCLSETVVLLLQATASGSETLKNLVLPGIGAFVVIDQTDVKATPTDAAVNFFAPLQEPTAAPSNDSGGDVSTEQNDAVPPKSRAQVVAESLQELNDDVKGDYRLVDDWLTVDYEVLFRSCSCNGNNGTPGRNVLVVASDLDPPALARVALACELQNVPLIVVHAYGLLGSVRLQTPPLPVLEPRPHSRDAVPDLRLANPFPALVQFAYSFDLMQLDDYQHGHVPYPVILLQAVREWNLHHGNCPPATFSEKQEFQSQVRNMARNFDNELNFQEAVQNAYMAYASPRKLDVQHLAHLQTSITTDNVAAAASLPSVRRFRALVGALQAFATIHGGGRVPLSGVLPDLTASTEWYVSLQSIHQTQAREDRLELRSLLDPIVATEIDDELLDALVRNALDLDVFHPRSLREEWDDDSTTMAVVPTELCDDLVAATLEGDERDDQLPLLWGLGLAACRKFYVQHLRYPGVMDDWEVDVDELQRYVVEVVQKYQLHDNELVQRTLLKDTKEYAIELARYGNAELHNIASLIGGVAGQEAVKIVTGQYVPIDHTYIYNGIASTGGVYRL